MHMLLDLFLSFAKVGVLTFGGGMAMLPMLQREIVEKKGWATEDELADYYAIGQCTPGIIAVNTATFVGQKQKGTAGGIIATLGVVFPSLVIITIIAALLGNFAEIVWVQKAFAGIRVAVSVLVLNSIYKLAKKNVTGRAGWIIFGLVFLGAVFFPVSPVVYVLLAAAAGLVLNGKAAEK